MVILFNKIIVHISTSNNNLTHTVTKNTNLERKKGNLVSLTENENVGSHTLFPLKEFRPRNSKSKFGLS